MDEMDKLAVGLITTMVLIAVGVAVATGPILNHVEGKSLKSAEIRANLIGVPYTCLNHPELYVRISDSAANPKTGEHDKLVGKITIENPSKASYKIKIKVDPKKVPSGLLREYLQILQHDGSGKDQIVYQDYSHPYTSLKAKSYKWVHNVPDICPP